MKKKAKKSFIGESIRKGMIFAAVAATVLFSASPAYAMHIAEGFLPALWCVVWGIAFVPFLIWGVKSASKLVKGDSHLALLLAMSGAFCFVLSALKLPSLTGSSSHPTGVGLGVLLFGPAATAFLGFLVLLFQALLLAHGGLTTLGANGFSMAVAGPFAGWAVWAITKKTKLPIWLRVFLCAFTADLFTYVVTAFQLAIAFPAGSFASTLLKFMGVFAVTQIPLAVMEGIITVLVYRAVVSICKNEVELLNPSMLADDAAEVV